MCVDYCAEEAIEFAPGRLRTVVRFRDPLRADGPRQARRRRGELRQAGHAVAPDAQQVASQQRLDVILCDGSPGIGCPVIASLTGASLALFVVEPTMSGLHDFLRVAQLTVRLGVPGVMAVNKADLNEEMTQSLEQSARQRGIDVVGRIPYDPAVTQSQIARKTVVEASDGPACAGDPPRVERNPEAFGVGCRVDGRRPGADRAVSRFC